MKPSLLAFIEKGGLIAEDLQAKLNHLADDLEIFDHKIINSDLDNLLKYLSKHTSPQVLIIDLHNINQTTDISRTQLLNQLAEVCEPGTKVIILGDEIPLIEYRQLLDLGIEEYLALPLNYDALIHQVKISLGLSSSLKKVNHKNIVITGLQGGVGCTTLTAALGQKLAQLGTHTLLADVDVELGDLALFWSELNQPAVSVQQLQELNNLERISQPINERLTYLAISPSDTPEIPEKLEVEQLLEVLTVQATATLWDIPRHHKFANTLWQKADICIWVLEASVSVLHQWNSIKNKLEQVKLNEPGSSTRHIFVLNQTRKERSQQIAVKKLQQALQQELLILPYAGQQALDASNLAQSDLLLTGNYGHKLNEICAKVLTRANPKAKKVTPLKKFLVRLINKKSNRVTL